MALHRVAWIIIGIDGEDHIERKDHRGRAIKPYLQGFGSETAAITHANRMKIEYQKMQRLDFDEFERRNRAATQNSPLVRLGQGR